MKIRKVKKRDFEEYYKLKEDEEKEYSSLIGREIKFKDKQIKKDFNDCLKSKKRFILVLEIDGKIIGYSKVSLLGDNYKRFGYVDDIFIKKEFRKKGFGTKLISSTIKELKKKGAKMCRLGANIKNKKALRLYKKLGFKLTHYELDKKLK